MVAVICREIHSCAGNSSTGNHGMMPLPQTVMVFGDDSETVISFAVATVLSTLFGMEKLVLKRNGAGAPSEFPEKSVLIISDISQERQIGRLTGLRLHGFIGGALIISQASFESLRARPVSSIL